jgi:hypothetical protein
MSNFPLSFSWAAVSLDSFMKYGALMALVTSMLVGYSENTLALPSDRLARVNRSAAHPISVVEAKIFVQKNRMLMNLKCFADDLELIQGMEPLPDGTFDEDEMKEATRDHAEFLLDRIDILDANGHKMEGRIIEALPPDAPANQIKSGDLMSLFCNFQYEYNYDVPPEFITINQRMMGEGYILPSELQISMKQSGSDTPFQHIMKPEQPETFHFDWDNPILNQSASDEDWATWLDEQRKKTLGITSYSSVYSFIYITNHEVRHEILIPLASLALMIDFERADQSFLDIPEQDAAREKIATFFTADHDIQIDGVNVQPVVERIDFYGLDLRDFAIQAERRTISMASGRVGVILSYSTKTPPTNVRVEWKTFNEVSMQTVDSVIIAYDQITQTQFSRFLADNTYEWKSPARPPLPSIHAISADITQQMNRRKLPIGLLAPLVVGGVLLGLGALRKSATLGVLACLVALIAIPLREFSVDSILSNRTLQIADDDATSIFSRLHQNVFRAFDYHHEGEVYDALAHSVHGDLLQELYLQIHQRLVMADQGGAAARIDSVDLIDGKVVPTEQENPLPGFTYRAKWNLLGTVEHWGHLHQRTSQFDAEFYVALVEGKWKITEMRSLNEEQIGVKTSLRNFGT